jgi:A/G-specific adenine glycosylase
MEIEHKKISQKLTECGRLNYAQYPWRELEDPWAALIAEVVLQRTNAKHVDRYFYEMYRLFPTPESVIEASDKELELVKSRFGLGRRMRTLRELAEFIDTQDIYPTECDTLISLYGIGHYTAAAYLSLHMDIRAVLVDSNAARWLSRMTGKEKPKDVRRCKWIWDLEDRLTPKKNFKEYNYAVLDFSMTICKPRNPACETCLLNQMCKYPKRGNSHKKVSSE